MEFHVSNEIKKSAINCRKKFICLSRNEANICKVISSVNNDVIFVYCQNNCVCVYQHNFNNRIICTCPVRLEIYSKYDI